MKLWIVYFRGTVIIHRGCDGGCGLRCSRCHRCCVAIGHSSVMLRSRIISRPALIRHGIGRRKSVIEGESSTTGVVR